MTYEEFEWHILRLVYEEGVERIQPAYLAYALGIPHEKATEYLDRATQNGVVEMDVTEDGSIEYFIPGADPDNPMPSPVWKEGDAPETDSAMDYDAARQKKREESGEYSESARSADALMQTRAQQDAGPQTGDDVPEADGAPGGKPAGRGEASPDSVSARSDSDSGWTGRGENVGRTQDQRGQKVPTNPPEDTGADGSLASAENDTGPGTTVATRSTPDIPPEFRDAIRSTDQADGTLDPSQGGRLTVVGENASVEEGSPNGRNNVLQALEDSDRDLPIRIESTDETFSDPSQTIFMRQLRVEGVESEEALRQHVHRLFESLGYNIVEDENDRMRFERGSVTFILALVPLFVLVLPLFVYLFLYCMGRSTIHQEPLELDVQLRQSAERDDVYEIDLTFIGLHGVVLGAADQRVLNKEVDTLRDELQWALTTG